MKTTVPNPGAGWGWIVDGLASLRSYNTRLNQLWDGLFTATCPCGRDANWDAYAIEPLCICPLVTS